MSETSTKLITSDAIQQAEERLRTLLPSIYRNRTDDVQPVSMGSAPLAFDVDGNVAWDSIWGSFCDLAMAGGPPHKGKLLEPGTPESIFGEPARYGEVCDEIVRGIGLAARLHAAPSPSPGWLRVQCANHTMAEWLLRAITMENISVRLEESAILLPAGPAFRVEKEIKNVITVAAKTTHYWSGHLIRLQQIGIANLFDQLNSEAPLLQPAWASSAENAGARECIQRALEDATGLQITDHSYAEWIGLDCGGVPSAITTMCRLVASNILCRREEAVIFVPLNPATDPHGTRLARSVGELCPAIEPNAVPEIVSLK
jgi:sirohydrochlorin cobaltochelatase